MPPDDGIPQSVRKFFILEPSSELDPIPATSLGNSAVHLIDGFNYFGQILTEINNLSSPGGRGKFFYFANWFVELINRPKGPMTVRGQTAWKQDLDQLAAFRFSPSIPILMDQLGEMASNGTDVRALFWFLPVCAFSPTPFVPEGIFYVNYSNLFGADGLRKKRGLEKKVCLFTCAHILGSMHLKIIICGDSNSARAYVSGLDFVSSRIDDQQHGRPVGWHDVGVKVQGSALNAIYGYFQQIWNELVSDNGNAQVFRVNNKKIRNFAQGTPIVDNKTFGPIQDGKVYVQVLRTVPQMNFSPDGKLKQYLPAYKPPARWKSAPNGIFEFQAALKKAISEAQKFIYAEDQYFDSYDIMDWIRSRLVDPSVPELKVIFVYNSDPMDNPTDAPIYRIPLNLAINRHLANNIGGTRDRIAFYHRDLGNVTIHSKTWIIDDEYAIIGTTNCSRRSLYTDVEISLAIIDDVAADQNFVKQYRMALWGEHCGLFSEEELRRLSDINSALAIWKSSWGTGNPPATLRRNSPTGEPYYKLKRVPFEQGTSPDQWRELLMSYPTPRQDYIATVIERADSRDTF